MMCIIVYYNTINYQIQLLFNYFTHGVNIILWYLYWWCVCLLRIHLFELQELYKFYQRVHIKEFSNSEIFEPFSWCSQKFILHALNHVTQMGVCLFEKLTNQSERCEAKYESLWVLYTKSLTQTIEGLKRQIDSSHSSTKEDLLVSTLLLLLASFQPNQVDQLIVYIYIHVCVCTHR